jgi:hypothetical protein
MPLAWPSPSGEQTTMKIRSKIKMRKMIKIKSTIKIRTHHFESAEPNNPYNPVAPIYRNLNHLLAQARNSW